jgi:hypothetical protein
MNLQENTRVNLATELKRKGFKLDSQFGEMDKRQLAIPGFGLCSYAAIYCRDKEAVPELVNFLPEVEGIDFSVSLNGSSGVLVKGAKGSALIESRAENGNTAYRYVPTDGDPLKLNDLLKTLADEGKLDDQGFASDETLYSATNAHVYPDALANIYKSLHTDRVKHQADVLISIDDGYYYGWSAFGKFVELRATHGNALRQSSNAFLMSTHRELPECVRADDAGKYLRQ